jgi:hypothetical protein
MKNHSTAGGSGGAKVVFSVLMKLVRPRGIEPLFAP